MLGVHISQALTYTPPPLGYPLPLTHPLTQDPPPGYPPVGSTPIQGPGACLWSSVSDDSASWSVLGLVSGPGALSLVHGPCLCDCCSAPTMQRAQRCLKPLLKGYTPWDTSGDTPGIPWGIPPWTWGITRGIPRGTPPGIPWALRPACNEWQR